MASLQRRDFLKLLLGSTAFIGSAASAAGQALSTQPVRIVVGFAAGGPSDSIARLLADLLGQQLQRPVIVENRSGAAGNLASKFVANAYPDGRTLLFLTAADVINVKLHPDDPFNFHKDILPVAGVMRAPHLMTVHPSFPAYTVPEFVAYAKTHRQGLRYGSGGYGSTVHLSGEMLNMLAGLDMTHIPYRGAGPALNDLLGSHLDTMFDVISSSIELVRAGKLRALAVTGATRSPMLPDVPALSEYYPDYETTTFFGVGAPNATPRDLIVALNKSINSSLEEDVFKKRLAGLGAGTLTCSPEELGELMDRESLKWARVVDFMNGRSR